MTRGQWALWIAGGVASVLALGVIGAPKALPDWYLWLFLAGALFCLAAGAASLWLRKTRRGPANKEGWIEALSTARLGLLVLIAVAVVVAGMILFRVGK